MKKFILPVLISVVALTSCTQALYKDKYDWVKVDRVETQFTKEPVVVQVAFGEKKKEVNAERMVVEKNLSPKTVTQNQIAFDTIPGDSLKSRETKTSGTKRAETKQAKKISTGYLTIDLNPDFSLKGKDKGNGKVKVKEKNSNLSTEEKGYLAAGIAILILLILGAALGPGIFINSILFLYYLVKLGAALVVAGAIIYGLLWLLFGEINMNIFFWTMK